MLNATSSLSIPLLTPHPPPQLPTPTRPTLDPLSLATGPIFFCSKAAKNEPNLSAASPGGLFWVMEVPRALLEVPSDFPTFFRYVDEIDFFFNHKTPKSQFLSTEITPAVKAFKMKSIWVAKYLGQAAELWDAAVQLDTAVSL